MQKKLIIKQEEASDCGVCCLESIIRYYGGNASLEDLRISSLTNRDGVSAYNLIECAKLYGFDAIGINTGKLNNKYLPCIAHLKVNESLSHFVVIYSINNDKILLMDPSFGKRVMDLNDFKKLSTNNFILLKPKTNLSYITHPNLIKINLKKSFVDNKYKFIFIIVLNLIYIFLSILSSFYITYLEKFRNYLITTLIFVAIIIITNIISYIINNKINKLTNDISTSFLSNFFKHIFKLPLSYIHIKDSGEIIHRAQEAEELKNITTNTFINSILNLLIINITLIIIYCINKKVFILSFISISIYILITIITNRKINDSINEVIEYNTDYNSNLVDVFSGLNSINHAKSSKYFLNHLNNLYKNYLNIRYKYDNNVLKANFLKQSLVGSIELVINIILIIDILNGLSDFSVFVIINFLNNILFNSMYSFGNLIPSIIYQNKLISKLNEFYNVGEVINKGMEFEMNDINIKNLSFSYNKYNYVLNNINIFIKKNEKVIIKGISGCGKSTICKLLNKEYDDYKGNILIGNNEVKDISLSSLRNNISYSSQSEKIFNGTIKDNILMGHEISDGRLKNIINLCDLNRVIDKKTFGLDTFLFAGGEELSGGERQLIFLARALVSDFNLLILDETLSEVNDSIEDDILNKLFNYFKDKTIIYISHKNSKEYFSRTICI